MPPPLASQGPFAVSAFGNGVNSDGYRVNDYVRQRNAVGDLRYTGDEGSAWFNISGDDQHLGLPGARLVDVNAGINELVTDRRGATTPNAFSSKTGGSLTFGVSRMIGSSVELIVDGNLRRKDQTIFSSLFGFDTSDIRDAHHRLGDAAREHQHPIVRRAHQDHDRLRLLQFQS